MNPSALSVPTPSLLPVPSSMGDWQDSSFELQRGVLVQELPAHWWDDCVAAANTASGARPQTAH